jgi:GDPmannose 4,6-dehydratase
VGVVSGDPAFERPADVQNLCGDASKARRVLGWEPAVRFSEIVKRLVEASC